MLMIDTEPNPATAITPWASTSHSSWARCGSAAWAWGRSLCRSYWRVNFCSFRKAAIRARLGNFSLAKASSASSSVRIVSGPQPGWLARISFTAALTGADDWLNAPLAGRPSRETNPARPDRWYFRRHLRTTLGDKFIARAISGSLWPSAQRSPISTRSTRLIARPRWPIAALLALGFSSPSTLAALVSPSTGAVRLFETFVKVHPV